MELEENDNNQKSLTFNFYSLIYITIKSGFILLLEPTGPRSTKNKEKNLKGSEKAGFLIALQICRIFLMDTH